VEAELTRLEVASEQARADLAALRESLGAATAVSEIFVAHAAMLEDLSPRLVAAVRRGTSAEHAVATVLHALALQLRQSRDPLLAQRAQDIVDLERRLLHALAGVRAQDAVESRPEGGPAILVARDLTPSEAAGLQGADVAAIALELGGHTSHAAVIIKSLGIPCVMGVEGLVSRVAPGQVAWVDGSAGTVVVEPDAAAMERAQERGRRYQRLEAALLGESGLPAETLDGHRAILMANIEYPLDVDAALARGAEGVGLYRTEFLYERGAELPDEETHYEAYRQALERMGGRRLTIRTYDFGADKENPRAPAIPEPNPALGVRSLRWCFEHPEPFRAQLRALLRVAAHGDVRVMFPMVGGLDEVRRAKAHLAEAAAELTLRGVPHRADLPVGVMIEIPAAAVTADLLAREVDFFSIGTNDLIQYDLAVDRMNPRLEPLFRPSHPSLLRLVQAAIDAAAGAGIPVTMCGEMGGHSIYTVLLFGLGLREFSLTPGYIPRARRLLRGLTLREARRIARECLRLETARDVEQLLRERVREVGAG
jgi:phosphotransferase system enzyme I (PtsI)